MTSSPTCRRSSRSSASSDYGLFGTAGDADVRHLVLGAAISELDDARPARALVRNLRVADEGSGRTGIIQLRDRCTEDEVTISELDDARPARALVRNLRVAVLELVERHVEAGFLDLVLPLPVRLFESGFPVAHDDARRAFQVRLGDGELGRGREVLREPGVAVEGVGTALDLRRLGALLLFLLVAAAARRDKTEGERKGNRKDPRLHPAGS